MTSDLQSYEAVQDAILAWAKAATEAATPIFEAMVKALQPVLDAIAEFVASPEGQRFLLWGRIGRLAYYLPLPLVRWLNGGWLCKEAQRGTQ